MGKFLVFIGGVASIVTILTYFGITAPKSGPAQSGNGTEVRHHRFSGPSYAGGTSSTSGSPIGETANPAPASTLSLEAQNTTRAFCEQQLHMFETNPTFYGSGYVDQMKAERCDRWITIPPYPQ